MNGTGREIWQAFYQSSDTSWPPLSLRADPGPMSVRGLEVYFTVAFPDAGKETLFGLRGQMPRWEKCSVGSHLHPVKSWCEVSYQHFYSVYFCDKECVGDASEDEGFSAVPTGAERNGGSGQGWHGLSLLVSLKLGLEESCFLLQSPLCSRDQRKWGALRTPLFKKTDFLKNLGRN